MGVRVCVSASKEGKVFFHKLSYYGPIFVDLHNDVLYVYIEENNIRKQLAAIRDWVYFEYVEHCEDNRKKYKESINES